METSAPAHSILSQLKTVSCLIIDKIGSYNMSDLRNRRLKKQRENLEKSRRWLRRAQMDLNALQHDIVAGQRQAAEQFRCFQGQDPH